MINENIELFIDSLHYGQDIYLKYGDKKLFIDGWQEDKIFTLRMIDCNLKSKESIFNFSISNEDKEKVIEEFLNQKVWNGKTFYEEAKNIEWSEPF